MARRLIRSERRAAARRAEMASRIMDGIIGALSAVSGAMLAAFAGWLYNAAAALPNPQADGLLHALICAVFAIMGVGTMIGGCVMALGAMERR